MTRANSTAVLSPDEVVALLGRSKLPTVITEGRDDYIAYRFLERRLSDISISFLPVGGKEAVLEIWRKLSGKNVPLIALIDKDTWLYTGTPQEFSTPTVIMTGGYSIENDLYIDGDLPSLLTAEEQASFTQEIATVCAWYDGELSALLQGLDSNIALHPNQVLQMDTGDFKEPGAGTVSVHSDYQVLLRGKTLIATIMRQLNRRNRVPKHNYLSLYEMAASRIGPMLSNIEEKIRQAVS